jgi:Uma2 family endonuclease
MNGAFGMWRDRDDLIPLEELRAEWDREVTIGNPVTIAEGDSEPEPDAMIVRGQIRDFAGRRRTPADAVLVIEVADTSYALDRGPKWAIDAAAGVPVYWIVDLNRNRVEVHSEPAGRGAEARYSLTRLYAADEEIPLVLDGREAARFAAREILR